jgi:O-acetyl-ADP-ribose deacetylase (regulator of RNase III)
MGRYINQLYYITHIDNLPSILEHGILSHRLIQKEKINFTPIYSEDIVSRRSHRIVSNDKTLWDFANLYFLARNPMLYKVKCDKSIEQIIVLGVRKDVMDTKGVFITDGNAANLPTTIVPRSKVGKESWAEISANIEREWWSQGDDSKRKIMAECLVPESVPPGYIQTIYTANLDVREKVERIIQGSDTPIVPQADMFFEPTRKIRLKDNLYLVEGDMFFSKQQTLTISVNCMGVMGKGLASRTRYQFPAVYVYYEDLCKQKKLRLGMPYLYKGGLSRDYELADEPASLENGVTETWFLLFPTKDNWRNRADIKGIKKGLQWVCDNYRAEGIKSLAMPALGCGLGWLDWSEVGPLLCTHLASIDIQTWVYLPTKREIPEDQLDAKFLIRGRTL